MEGCKNTQTCPIPFKYGVPKNSWWFFECKHPKLTICLVDFDIHFDLQGTRKNQEWYKGLLTCIGFTPLVLSQKFKTHWDS